MVYYIIKVVKIVCEVLVNLHDQVLWGLCVHPLTYLLLSIYFLLACVLVQTLNGIIPDGDFFYLEWKHYTLGVLFFLIVVSYYGNYILFTIVVVCAVLVFYGKGVVFCGELTSMSMFGHYIVPLIALQEISSWALAKHGFEFVQGKILLSDIHSESDNIMVGRWHLLDRTKLPNMSGHFCLVTNQLHGSSYSSSPNTFHHDGNEINKIPDGRFLIKTYSHPCLDEFYNEFYQNGCILNAEFLDSDMNKTQFLTESVDYRRYSSFISVKELLKEEKDAIVSHFSMNGLKLSKVIGEDFESNGIINNRLDVLNRYERMVEENPQKILQLVSMLKYADNLSCDPSLGIYLYTESVKNVIKKE